MKEILIVDDNPANLAIIEQTLEEEYEVTALTSGMRALRFLEVNHTDLILLDVEMPIMNGIQTLKKIREQPQFAKTPVIFLTARKDGYTVAEGFKLGISDYITKPFDPDDILARIKRVFQ